TALTQCFSVSASGENRAASIALRTRRTEGRSAIRSCGDDADRRLITPATLPSAIPCSRVDCRTNDWAIDSLSSSSCSGQDMFAWSARSLMLAEPGTRASQFTLDLTHAMFDAAAGDCYLERLGSHDTHRAFLDQLTRVEKAWMPIGVHRYVERQHAMEVSAV